jgi:outer membrane receptor protein involved in Fe transport
MKKINLLLKGLGFVLAMLLSNATFSQNENAVVKDSTKTNKLDEVVVTGVVNRKSRLESSVSVSSIGAKQIEQSAPRTTGEVFRNIPGVRAESSGGEGNANFNVRGVPVSSGGSRYLQLQEDGLPVMLFGDTSFGNSDNWLRIDSNIGRIESIRGGSASTQTSNGPAGIINMISKRWISFFNYWFRL